MIPATWDSATWTWDNWFIAVWLPTLLLLMLVGCYVAWKNAGPKE